MKLYVRCHHCGFRTYLNIIFNERNDLARHLGSYYFTMRCSHCGNEDNYNVNEVFAEEGPSAVPAGAVLGGILGGLIGGPVGLLLGGCIGGAVSGRGDVLERDRVRRFNRGQVQ